MSSSPPFVQLPPTAHTDTSTNLKYDSYTGPTRFVCLPHASSSGGSAIARSSDQSRCAVVGRESLRIIRVSDSPTPSGSDHRFVVGPGGHRVVASRNLWAGSGLKSDSSLTDVVWGRNSFDQKLLTSARNGELIMWDLNKTGSTKYERRSKDHMRAINSLTYSPVFHHCISGSSDGDLRVWDLRDMKSVMHIHHSAPVRTVIVSSSTANCYEVVSGLDNGSMFRWDLRKGQKMPLDRWPLAHAGSILGFDWCHPEGSSGGWLASAGIDRCVKVWNLNSSDSTSVAITGSSAPLSSPAIQNKPAYVLHASFPVRKVAWRPGHTMELAIASRNEYGTVLGSSRIGSVTPSLVADSSAQIKSSPLASFPSDASSSWNFEVVDTAVSTARRHTVENVNAAAPGDLIEIWDIRRAWIAKWAIEGSDIEGGVTDLTFRDPDALWVQHTSGAFSQMDLRDSFQPVKSVPHVALTWNPVGSLLFIANRSESSEVSHEDIPNVTEDVAARPDSSCSARPPGDRAFGPESQAVGKWTPDVAGKDYDKFIATAQQYVIHGGDRRTTCEQNAAIAFHAKDLAAGNIWSTVASLLEDSFYVPIPQEPDLKEASLRSKSQSKSLMNIPNNDPSPQQLGASIVSFQGEDNRQERSPASPMMSLESPVVLDLKGKLSSPSIHYREGTTPSYLNLSLSSQGRRQSTSSTITHFSKRPSFHKSSRSTSVVFSESVPELMPQSSWYRRDDSPDDSDSSSDSPDDSSQTSPPDRGEPTRSSPSPMDWHEDGSGIGSSVSSDSDGHGSDHSRASMTAVKAPSPSRHSRKMKESLGDSLLLSRKSFDKREAACVQTANRDTTSGNNRSRSGSITVKEASIRSGARRRSRAFSVNSTAHRHSELHPAGEHEHHTPLAEDLREGNSLLLQSDPKIPQPDENYRMAGWRSLQEEIEVLSAAGDVQMCAMLSCIVPMELCISRWRARQFVESYLDILARHRLYTVSAYIRKHCHLPDIRQETQIQTTTYTTCAKCGKAIVQTNTGSGIDQGSFHNGDSYCVKCKRHAVKCSICHLPVRAHSFSCPVCSQGGHEDCYRHYYMERPLIPLLRDAVEQGGRTNSRSRQLQRQTDKAPTSAANAVGQVRNMRISGHLCSTGCGHNCWIALAVSRLMEKAMP